MAGKKPKSDYVIQTVVNALHLLEEFLADGELGVTDLSRRLSLHKNNVFRLLATLEQCGYIEQSPANDRYRLGFRCLDLGEGFRRSHELLERARPILCELAAGARETTHLGFRDGFEVVHVDGEVYPQSILTPSRVGRRLPLHATALGKVLIAFADEETRRSFDRALSAGTGLEQLTQATIVDPAKFQAHLHTVAGQGFATDVEECEEGLCCAAAPIHDGTGQVVAALSISGPAFRLGMDRLVAELVPELLGGAERLSRDLGYTPPPAATA